MILKQICIKILKHRITQNTKVLKHFEFDFTNKSRNKNKILFILNRRFNEYIFKISFFICLDSK